MALDLNVPPESAEEDDPFGGLPHGQDLPPPAGAHPLGDGDGAPSFDLNMAAYNQVRYFSGPQHTVYMHAYT